MKILLAVITMAMFSSVALANEDFKGERLTSEVREALKAEFKAKKEAIKELPEAERKAAMESLRAERKAKKVEALQAAGVSDEDITKRMEKQKEKRKKRRKGKKSE